MAVAPQFASTPKIGIGVISTSNNNFDGTGTVVTVMSAGSSGTKVNEIAVQAAGTVTAGVVRIFINNGTTNFLFDEFQITATMPSSSVTAYRSYKAYENLVLPTGYSIRASTSNSESFNVIALGADL